LAKKQELETTLYHLPKPNKKHLESLDNILFRIEKAMGLTPADMGKRVAISNRIDELLKPVIPGCFVRVYGSSLTGLGLVTSGLNLDLQIPSEIPPHKALMRSFETLVVKSDEFSNVQPDFTAKIPAIVFFVGEIRCELSLNNHMAYQTSALLRDYAMLDSRYFIEKIYNIIKL
jgi:DNA polymerase sigma